MFPPYLPQIARCNQISVLKGSFSSLSSGQKWQTHHRTVWSGQIKNNHESSVFGSVCWNKSVALSRTDVLTGLTSHQEKVCSKVEKQTCSHHQKNFWVQTWILWQPSNCTQTWQHTHPLTEDLCCFFDFEPSFEKQLQGFCGTYSGMKPKTMLSGNLNIKATRRHRSLVSGSQIKFPQQYQNCKVSEIERFSLCKSCCWWKFIVANLQHKTKEVSFLLWKAFSYSTKEIWEGWLVSCVANHRQDGGGQWRRQRGDMGRCALGA